MAQVGRRGGWGSLLGAVLVGIPVALGNLALLLQSLGKVVGTFSNMTTHGRTGDRFAESFTLGWMLFCWEVVGGLLLLGLGQLFRGRFRLLGRSLGGGLLLGVVLTGVFFLLAVGVCFAVLARKAHS